MFIEGSSSACVQCAVCTYTIAVGTDLYAVSKHRHVHADYVFPIYMRLLSHTLFFLEFNSMMISIKIINEELYWNRCLLE